MTVHAPAPARWKTIGRPLSSSVTIVVEPSSRDEPEMIAPACALVLTETGVVS